MINLAHIPIEKMVGENTAILILIYASLLFVWLGYQLNPVFLSNKSKFVVRKKDRSSLYSSSYSSQFNSFLLYTLSYLISLSVFIFALFSNTNAELAIWYLPGIILSISIYHSIKYLIYRFVVIPVFSSPIPVGMVIQSYLFINIITGLLLLPCTIGLLYVNGAVSNAVFTVSGLIIIGFYFILVSIRMFYIFSSNITSLIYLILYLCTLEIVPVLLVLKFAIEKLIIIE